jgi:hypothetical protein
MRTMYRILNLKSKSYDVIGFQLRLSVRDDVFGLQIIATPDHSDICTCIRQAIVWEPATFGPVKLRSYRIQPLNSTILSKDRRRR